MNILNSKPSQGKPLDKINEEREHIKKKDNQAHLALNEPNNQNGRTMMFETAILTRKTKQILTIELINYGKNIFKKWQMNPNNNNINHTKRLLQIY